MKWTNACIDGINRLLAESGAPQLQPLPVTEKEFQASVVALAKRNGWLVWHCTIARKSGAGWPDLTMARGNRLIMAELKVGKNDLTAPQRTWMDELGKVAAASGGAVQAVVWRETMWVAIEAALV